MSPLGSSAPGSSVATNCVEPCLGSWGPAAQDAAAGRRRVDGGVAVGPEDDDRTVGLQEARPELGPLAAVTRSSKDRSICSEGWSR